MDENTRLAAQYRRWALDADTPEQAEDRARYQRLESARRLDVADAQARITTQQEVVAQAVRERDVAAELAVTQISEITGSDGLDDSWWDDWGAKLVTWITNLAEIISAIAGILALLAAFIPIIGPALAGVLMLVSAVAAIIGALGNIALAATGERTWGEAILSIVGAALACVGLGALKGAFSGLKGALGTWKTGRVLDAFGGVGGLARATLNNFVTSLRNVAHSLTNSFNSVFRPGVRPPTRPTWRQSEIDVGAQYPGYSSQQSYLGGNPVNGNPPGSTRPDWSNDGPPPHGIEVKNYLIPSNLSSLVSKLGTQIPYRAGQMPPGAIQTIILDVRTQGVNIATRHQVYADILSGIGSTRAGILFMA